VGTAMSVTAFPVLARILTDRNMHRTRIGSIALASAATDDVLAWSLLAVLAGLLLSSFATDWMGVKYIFGAFLFGVVMPREGAAAALREEILDRLEQVSVLVLLPVFFVVSGLSVNLSSVGLSGLTELCLILLVAVVGKFGGA